VNVFTAFSAFDYNGHARCNRCKRVSARALSVNGPLCVALTDSEITTVETADAECIANLGPDNKLKIAKFDLYETESVIDLVCDPYPLYRRLDEAEDQ